MRSSLAVRSDVVILPYVVQRGVHVLKRVMGWQRAETYFSSNVIHDHVMKFGTDNVEDVALVGGEAM